MALWRGKVKASLNLFPFDERAMSEDFFPRSAIGQRDMRLDF